MTGIHPPPAGKFIVSLSNLTDLIEIEMSRGILKESEKSIRQGVAGITVNIYFY